MTGDYQTSSLILLQHHLYCIWLAGLIIAWCQQQHTCKHIVNPPSTHTAFVYGLQPFSYYDWSFSGVSLFLNHLVILNEARIFNCDGKAAVSAGSQPFPWHVRSVCICNTWVAQVTLFDIHWCVVFVAPLRLFLFIHLQTHASQNLVNGAPARLSGKSKCFSNDRSNQAAIQLASLSFNQW